VLASGTIVGEKYRLEEPIGQGGMATVWKAVHTTLDRPIAVKFLEAVGTSSQQLAERFLQEAKLAAGLRHRHVVDILDFGVHEGQPYMVMEFLAGTSLADRYSEGPAVTDFELLEIVAMTLSGLAAVHDAGIIHRDVKPENIFLVEDADGIYPKLLDFGISRGFGQAGRITRTGAVVGTPQYMSPEQARGLKDIDLRTDLWSAGIVLYEGFTGEVPFDSENPGDVLIGVATEDVLPLSELRPDLPVSVIELVHRALRKDRTERFQTARDMRDAVLAALDHSDPMGGRPSTGRIRTAYASSPGTGRIRVLTAPAEPVASDEHDIPVDIAAPELVPARLPPPAPTGVTAPKAEGGIGWGIPIVVLLLLVAAGGAYGAYHYGLLPIGAPPAVGGEGEITGGEEVPLAAREAESIEIEPPPDDGLPAPPSQTIDVPSPPDPPERAEEQAIGDEPPPDAGVVDAGQAPPERPLRRRRARRRPP
jgi:hypothetical protein